MNLAHVAILTALFSASCADDPPATSGGPLDHVVVSHPEAAPIAPATECTVMTADQQTDSRDHVANCSALTFESVPPAGGVHYAAWADFKSYDAPIPWGFLIHDLEHGAVVFAAGCGDACPEVWDAFDQVIADHPDDEQCAAGIKRFVTVPDPELPTPIVAVAWNKIYQATCLDLPSLSAFVEANYARAPEDECAPGIDHSSTGWCE